MDGMKFGTVYAYISEVAFQRENTQSQRSEVCFIRFIMSPGRYL